MASDVTPNSSNSERPDPADDPARPGPSDPIASPPMPADPMGDDMGEAAMELVLVKDGRRFVFRYHRGEESQVLESIAGMARDPESKLTLFDAAVLSHQMGQSMRQRLEKLLRA